MNALHTEQLDPMHCSNPDCTDPACNAVVHLIQVCHPHAGLDVAYVKADKVLVATCNYCDKPVAMLKIASEHVIPLTPAEIQSKYDRVAWAEGLIRQLPPHHDGRNSWLLNYGRAGGA